MMISDDVHKKFEGHELGERISLETKQKDLTSRRGKLSVSVPLQGNSRKRFECP